MNRTDIMNVSYKSRKQREYEKQVFERDKQIRQQATSYATKIIVAILCISLKDEYGFGGKRLTRLIKRIENNLECINAGTVDVNDFIKYYQEEILPTLELGDKNEQ